MQKAPVPTLPLPQLRSETKVLSSLLLVLSPWPLAIAGPPPSPPGTQCQWQAALPLQHGHCPVHVMLFLTADDHVGPILGQSSGDGKANPVDRQSTSQPHKDAGNLLYSSESCHRGQGPLGERLRP